MKSNFIDVITEIINDNSSQQNKIQKLQQEKNKRRGSNRIVLSILIDLLYDHNLPLSFEEKISIQSLKDFSEKEYGILSSIADKTTTSFFQAIYLEILWLHFHTQSLASRALNTYIEALKNENDDHRCDIITCAICRVYHNSRVDALDIEKFHKLSLEKCMRSNGHSSIALKSMMLATYSDTLENHVLNLIKEAETNTDYSEAIWLAKILVAVYKKKKRDKELQLWMCNLARYYELDANLLDWNNPSNAHRIIHLIQTAMRFWSDSKSPLAKNERKRLTQRIDPVKKLSLKAFQHFQSDPIDLSEVIEYIQSIVQSVSFEECIWKFAHAMNLLTPESLQEHHKGHFSLSSFFDTTVVNDDGRIVNIVPASHSTSQEDQIARLEYQAMHEYSILAETLVLPFLQITKERYSFNEENLEFIVENNILIPEERKRSFLKGLSAGFNYDYITALSILMPQIENAIRNLAISCGAVVYKTYPNGVEECLSLGQTLELPELEDCLDPDLLFNLKVFYTSSFGFGMRNNISHSLFSDDALSSPCGLIVWWFTLYLCCIYSPVLIRKVSEYRSNRNPNEQ